jgi:hypothetical protein
LYNVKEYKIVSIKYVSERFCSDVTRIEGKDGKIVIFVEVVISWEAVYF